jgi:serine/threonine-protein kinase
MSDGEGEKPAGAGVPKTVVATPDDRGVAIPETVAAAPAAADGRIAPTVAAQPIDETRAPDGTAAAATSAASRIGQVLGGYVIKRKLAEGGMGEVYEAEHASIGRRAAIKILKAELGKDADVVARFQQEARAVNEIRHENIVDVFAFGATPEGGVFYAMDFLEGETLAARLRRPPSVGWDESLAILREVIDALAEAHAKGFVHRDLKPDNIFLQRIGERTRVKLLDFGIAKLLGAGGASALRTRIGSMMGTPLYMSPEQIQGSATIDHRTDVYALGVILYEMWSGSTPFRGDTLGEILNGHLKSPAPRLHRTDVRGVPVAAADVVQRMLAKAPDDRYASVRDVLTDLLAADARRRPTTATVAAAAPRGRVPAWAIGGGLLVTLGAAAFVLTRRDPETPAPPSAAAAATVPAAPPAVDYAAARERAQALLRASLAEAAPSIRVAGSDAAGTTRDPGSARVLFDLAGADPSEEVRGHAASALGRIGHADARGTFAELEAKAAPPLQPWYAEALLDLGDAGARKRLLRYARSADLAVALKATLALAERSAPGDAAAIDALTALAAREAELNQAVPYAGVLLLTRLAALRAPGARELLRAALAQADEGAQLAAAEGLARLGDDAGAAVLAAIVAKADSPRRLDAAAVQAQLGDASPRALLEAALADPDPAARARAARGLGALGDTRTVGALLRLLDDRDWSVRIPAALALVAIVGLDPALLARGSVDWASSALASEDWAARQAAAGVLGDLAEADAAPLLAQAIADRRAEVRVAAARSAGRHRSAAIARQVATAALAERDPVAQEEQVKALGAIGDAAATDALRTLSQDDGRVGVFAAGSLIAVGDPSGKERLVEAVGDRRTPIRLAAVESAGQARNPTVVPVLSVGARDPVFEVRFTASEGLATFGAEQALAVPVLESGLASDSIRVQARAQVGLSRFGVASAEGLDVAALLGSASTEDRLAAVKVVAVQPWAEARPHLRQLVADGDPAVRRAALDAVTSFAGGERDGVIAILRTRIDDPDAVARAKARAQLSKLVEPLDPTAPPPAPTPTPAAPPIDAGAVEVEAPVAAPVVADAAPPPATPAALLAAAQRALDAGRPADARAALKAARAALDAAGTPPEATYHLLDGFVLRATAAGQKDDRARVRALRRARTAFNRVLRAGTPEQEATARQQLAELAPLLTDKLLPFEEADDDAEGAPAAPPPEPAPAPP